MNPTAERMTGLVQTPGGAVRGVERDGMRQFLGIPYAAPPCGDLRWRPPQPHGGWTTPLDAVAFGSVCAQSSAGRPGFAYDSETEDCLFLNVFAPAGGEGGGKRPVMVWFPGGGLFMGGADGYDPGALVRDGDVVCVTLNYRLNVFGFFSHPAINGEGHAAGNYGIMDQRAALEWVQANIEAFGGDAGRVTIFGESAGGVSVWAHLASPASRGLFHRAIILSGTGVPLARTPSLHSREQVGEALAEAAGCAGLGAAGLRALSARELLAVNTPPPGGFAAGRFNVGLMADGETIPEPMVDLFTTGRFARVPVINGTTRDEFTWFLALRELATGQVVTEGSYPGALAASLALALPQLFNVHVGADAVPDILARYPVRGFPSASNALAAAVGDCGLICNGGRRANRMLKRYVDGVYAYEFDVPDSPIAWPPASFPYQSAHTVELQYVFPGFHGASGTRHELSEAQAVLARQVVRYLTTFARTGAPGAGPDAPDWPAYDAGKDNYLSLRTPAPVAMEGFGERHHCDFWDAVQ